MGVDPGVFGNLDIGEVRVPPKMSHSFIQNCYCMFHFIKNEIFEATKTV